MTPLLWCLAGACVALLALVLWLLTRRPPRPPTLAERERAFDAELREREWRAGGKKW